MNKQLIYTYFAIVNPLFNALAFTIWWATFTIELPQAAPAPLNPSSVPNGFGGCLTSAMVNSVKDKIRQILIHMMWFIQRHFTRKLQISANNNNNNRNTQKKTLQTKFIILVRVSIIDGTCRLRVLNDKHEQTACSIAFDFFAVDIQL